MINRATRYRMRRGGERGREGRETEVRREVLEGIKK